MDVTPVFTSEEKTAAKVNALREETEYLCAVLPLMIENQAMCAKLTRAKYLSLVDAGFTKNEAFALCK